MSNATLFSIEQRRRANNLFFFPKIKNSLGRARSRFKNSHNTWFLWNFSPSLKKKTCSLIEQCFYFSLLFSHFSFFFSFFSSFCHLLVIFLLTFWPLKRILTVFGTSTFYGPIHIHHLLPSNVGPHQTNGQDCHHLLQWEKSQIATQDSFPPMWHPNQ